MAALKFYILTLILAALSIYTWVIMIYCVASFFVRNRYAAWFVFLSELVQPPLQRIRRWTGNRLVIEGFDLSPVLLIVFIIVLKRILGHLA